MPVRKFSRSAATAAASAVIAMGVATPVSWATPATHQANSPARADVEDRTGLPTAAFDPVPDPTANPDLVSGVGQQDAPAVVPAVPSVPVAGVVSVISDRNAKTDVTPVRWDR